MPEDTPVFRLVAEPAADPAADGDLLEHARVLWRWRRLLVGAVVGTAAVTAVVNLVLPLRWRATASLLPVTGNHGPSLPPALAQALGGLAPQALKGTEATDRFVTILQSRTVAEGVIADCDLLPALAVTDLRDAVRTVQEKVLSVETTARGAIEVSAEWRDPEGAARIANAAVARLERFLHEHDLTLAARHRRFVEARRDETRRDLATAEEALKGFAEKHGMISVPEQTRALFEAIGMMQGKIQIEEAHLDVMRESRGTGDPEVRRQEALVQALKNRLVELEHGTPPDPGVKVQANGLVPLYQLPETSLDHGRLLRDVTVLNEVFTLLSGEVERAKLEERRDAAAVQVLDAAKPPDRKWGPRRTENTLLAAVVAAFLGVLWAFGAEGVRKLRGRAAAERAPAGPGSPAPASTPDVPPAAGAR